MEYGIQLCLDWCTTNRLSCQAMVGKRRKRLATVAALFQPS